MDEIVGDFVKNHVNKVEVATPKATKVAVPKAKKAPKNTLPAAEKAPAKKAATKKKLVSGKKKK